MPAKLVILGIDAAEPSLVRQWMLDGKLPALRALVSRGVSGSVRGVDGFFVGSTWPSFYTGLGPAGHGFYRVEQLESGTYGFFRPLETPSGTGGVPFWRLASDAGRRVAVLDVPLTHLEASLEGIQIVEWGGHDAVFGFHTFPPDLAGEVLAQVGAYPIPSECDARRTTASDFEHFISSLEDAIARKATLTAELLDRQDWDLFVQVFTESHCVGHQCWHLHDPTHPAHDPRTRDAVGDPLERVYRALDGAVGSVVERVGDASVLVLSAHGMGAYRGADFLLPEILSRLGVTVPSPAPPTPRAGAVVGLARAVHRRLPRAARAALRRTRREQGLTAPVRGRVDEQVDVRASRCFAVPNGSPVSGIRLNLAGREPEGILLPSQAEAFCDELAHDLLEITDERTGAPLISAVDRTNSLHLGSRLDALPDLLVTWSDAVATGTLAHAGGHGATVRALSTKIGVVEGQNGYGRTGEHFPTGFFVFAGPDVPAARTRDDVEVTDFFPTICALLGLGGASVDGDIIRELAGMPSKRHTTD